MSTWFGIILVQRIVRAYDSYGRAQQQLPLEMGDAGIGSPGLEAAEVRGSAAEADLVSRNRLPKERRMPWYFYLLEFLAECFWPMGFLILCRGSAAIRFRRRLRSRRDRASRRLW